MSASIRGPLVALLTAAVVAVPAESSTRGSEPPPPSAPQSSGSLPHLSYAITVNAAPEEVWRLWTDPEAATTWFAPQAHIELRAGGAYELYFNPEAEPGTRGGEGNRVLAFEPANRLVVTWNAPVLFGPLRDQRTVVSIQLEAVGTGRTAVHLVHDGWGDSVSWAPVRAYFAEAWPLVLGRLAHRVSEGARDWAHPDPPDVTAPVLALASDTATPLPAPPGFEPAMVVRLQPGPALSGATREEFAAAQARHGANIGRWISEGLVALAGPLVYVEPDMEDTLALIVFRLQDRSEVARLLAEDPSVAAGFFRWSATPWWLPRRAETPSPVSTPAQTPERTSCTQPVFAELDFWIGAWIVESNGTVQGTNRISRILAGCAIHEEWEDAQGGRGESLFYVSPEGTWRQVWVTEDATRLGGVKEKTLVEPDPEMAPGSVRFQGELPHPSGGRLIDRTTLTPREDGTVRQHIEISHDGGLTWRTTFDAVYRPQA